MMQKIIELKNSTARGYAIEAGAFNILIATTGKGLIGCSAFSVEALENLSYPAAVVQGPVSTIEQMLDAKVVRVNSFAKELGINTSLTGKEALELMA